LSPSPWCFRKRRYRHSLPKQYIAARTGRQQLCSSVFSSLCFIVSSAINFEGTDCAVSTACYNNDNNASCDAYPDTCRFHPAGWVKLKNNPLQYMYNTTFKQATQLNSNSDTVYQNYKHVAALSS
jgi:hypothetical protein